MVLEGDNFDEAVAAARLWPEQSGAERCGFRLTWIADDGWVWYPMGMVFVWSLKAWLQNVYEAEDGDSKHRLLDCAYYWDRPLCWIDAHRVAVEGIGEDDAMIRGATISDARSGEQLARFAGPSGEFWNDGTRLFSVESGARTGILRDFRPNFKLENALAQIEGNTMTIWRFN